MHLILLPPLPQCSQHYLANPRLYYEESRRLFQKQKTILSKSSLKMRLDKGRIVRPFSSSSKISENHCFFFAVSNSVSDGLLLLPLPLHPRLLLHPHQLSLFTSVERDIQFILSHWTQQTRVRAAAVFAGGHYCFVFKKLLCTYDSCNDIVPSPSFLFTLSWPQLMPSLCQRQYTVENSKWFIK